MKPNLPLSAAVLCTATSAGAADICDRLDAILEGGVGANASITYDLAGVPAKCSTSLSIGGQRALNCAWGYDFRSEVAQHGFSSLTASIAACLGEADVALDQPVSHPDFYDLRVYQSPKGEVGVSLKDKGALQQTFVFLRITPTAKS